MTFIPRRKNFKAIVLAAHVAVLTLAAFAGCAHAAPADDDREIPAAESLAAYGTAMLHLLDAERMERAAPNESITHWQSATAILEQARANDPKNPYLIKLLAACHLRLGEFDKAAAICDPLIKSGEIDSNILIPLVVTMVKLKDFDRAATMAETYLSNTKDLTAIAPSQLIEELGELYTITDMQDRGLKFLTGMLEANPNNSQIGRVLIELTAKKQGDEAATKIARDFLETNPEEVRIRAMLAYLYLKTEHDDEASAELDDLLKREDLPLDVRLAIAQRTLLLVSKAETTEEREKALALIERVNADAAQIFSDQLVFQLQLNEARLHIELKNFEKAEELLRMLAAEPGVTWQIHGALAEVSWDLGKKDEAIAELRKYADDLVPGDDLRRIRMLLADFLEKNGDREGAVAELRKNLADQPDDAETCNHLGYLFAVWGQNLDESVTLIKTALDTEPDNAAFLDSLGWAYYKIALRDDDVDKLHEAGVLIKQALKDMPDDPTICQHMGDIYFVEGRFEDALTNWQTAINASEQDAANFPERARIIENANYVQKLINEQNIPQELPARPLKPPPDLVGSNDDVKDPTN